MIAKMGADLLQVGLWCRNRSPVFSFVFSRVFRQMCPCGSEHYLKALGETEEEAGWETWLGFLGILWDL